MTAIRGQFRQYLLLDEDCIKGGNKMLGIIILTGLAIANGIMGYKFKYPWSWFMCGFCSAGVLILIKTGM